MSKASELRALIALAEKATPGEWHWTVHDYSTATLSGPDCMMDHVLDVHPCGSCQEHAKETAGDREVEWEWGRCTTPRWDNAAYIAACSPDKLIPLLTAAAEAMEREEAMIGPYSSGPYWSSDVEL